MNRRYVIYGMIALFMLTSSIKLIGQTIQKPKIEFKNAPVLFKENNEFCQQLFAICQSDQEGKILFTSKGKELLTAGLKKGENKYLLTVPATTRPKKIVISVKTNNHSAENYSIVLIPPKKKEIYLVQHTHTDIGYTQPQAEILPKHMHFIDMALDFCDQTDNLPDEAKFRWTCESAWAVMEYLRSRPVTQIERLKKRILEGRIEVTAMHSNMTELFDENILYDFLKPLQEFNRSGIPVRMAMQNDINGIAWCMPDYFKNTGVKYLDVGSNETRSILPFNVPTCFWWESPSGERMLAFLADHYHIGNILGIGNKAIPFTEKILWYLTDLDNKNYPFDKISLQFSGYYADNSTPSLAACDLVKQWNSTYEYPKLRLATASEFFEYIENDHADELPVYRKAWLDWWSDGVGSSSRETAEARKIQNLKQVDEGLFAMISMMGGETGSSMQSTLDHLNESIIFFDEHTWGAGESVDNPYSENTTRQWMQKGAFAWEAVKSEALLREEALGRLEEHLTEADFSVIYVINSMGWKRSGNVQLFIDNNVLPAHKNVRIIDLVTGKEIPSQILHERGDGIYFSLEVNDIPALGYKVYKIEPVNQSDANKTTLNARLESMENQYYKLLIDKSTGAITSLFDKELNLELTDPQNPYKIGQLVRETLSSRETYLPSQSTVSNVKIINGIIGHVWESIRISADMDGFEKGSTNAPKGLELEIRLYKNMKKIELMYTARKEINTAPEALYVAFPFSFPDSRIVFETTGATLTQGQQLPGSASDWNVAQNFVSVRGNNGQIIVVSNEIPLWQFGDFNVGKFERYSKPGKPWLFSWVMNNYWVTNFRAFQEGGFRWTYQITSTKDTSNTYASRYSWNERNIFTTRSFAPGKKASVTPVMETLTVSGSENAMVVNCRPISEDPGNILLHLRELDGKSAEVFLSSFIPGRPVRKVLEVNSIGNPVGQPLTSVTLKPFEVKFIKVEFE